MKRRLTFVFTIGLSVALVALVIILQLLDMKINVRHHRLLGAIPTTKQ